MKPISNIPQLLCHNLKGIFCDIDDTLTTAGKLLESSYRALWQCKNAGLKVVPITGRPAGWVDHMARMWPVDAVIGENGAFYFWMHQGKMQRHFVQDTKTRIQNKEKLAEIRQKILNEVPQAAISADQEYRANDLAIDFCEDVPALKKSQISRIVEIFKEHGAQAKVSSIHVNGWFGNFNKMSTCKLLLSQLWQESNLEYYLYCGDSPNDEPMFKVFPHSVGVENINNWLEQMKFHPTYQTSAPGGDGFAELVDIVLQKRDFDET